MRMLVKVWCPILSSLPGLGIVMEHNPGTYVPGYVIAILDSQLRNQCGSGNAGWDRQGISLRDGTLELPMLKQPEAQGCGVERRKHTGWAQPGPRTTV